MKPSDSELILLKYFWEASRLSAREVHNLSSEQTKWAYSTTRKTLERMVEKDLLRVELVHGLKVFQASASKLETLACMINEFAGKVLDFEGPVPVAAFTGSRLIEEDELADLEHLLDALEQKAEPSR